MTGKFNAFKQKKAQYEKARRRRLKESLAHLSDSKRAKALSQSRLKTLARVQKCRQKKRQIAYHTDITMDQQISSSTVKIEDNSDSSLDNSGNDTSEHQTSSSCRPSYSKYDYDHHFATDEEFEAAVAKVERSLPKSPSLRKAVLIALISEFDEESQREIFGDCAKIKRTGHKRTFKANR